MNKKEPSLRVVMLGSGNVATHLAQALHTMNHDILQVYSPTYKNAERLAEKVHAQPMDRLESVTRTAQLYLFSVKDDALPSVIQQMPRTQGVWAHTAGSIPMNVFASRAHTFGVLYPLQTFSKAREIHFQTIPLFIEANNQEAYNLLESVARTLSNTVYPLPGDKRALLHLAAVFACNFTNHMYHLAQEIIQEGDIPFDALKPLIAETAQKVMEMPPREAQTGPAVRYDETVMREHLQRLSTPQLKELYTLISKSIHRHTR